MTEATVDLTELLECLSERLPALRQALLAASAAELEKIHVRAGESLLTRGETAHAVYVIGGIVLIAVKLLNLPISETHAWHAFAGGILALAQ